MQDKPGLGEQALDKAVELGISSQLDEVENIVGMGHGAWDCIDPKEIVVAAVKAWNKHSK